MFKFMKKDFHIVEKFVPLLLISVMIICAGLIHILAC